MTALFAAAVAAIPFGALAVAYRAAPTSIRHRSTTAIAVGVLAPAMWAALLPVHPTGIPLWDAVLAAAWVVAIGVLGAVAARHVLLAAGALVAIAAVVGNAGALPAALALGLAAGVTALSVRLPGPKALAGGLLGIATLQLDWPAPSPARVVLAAAVLAAVAASTSTRVARTTRRRAVIAAAGVLAVVGAAGVAFALTAAQVRDDLDAAVDLATDGLRAAEAGRTVDASAALQRARDRFVRASERMDSVLAQPVRLVPGAARNHAAIAAIAAAGAELATQAARVAADGDAGDVRLRDGALDLARAQRLATALTELTGQLHVAAAALDDAASAWLVPPVDDALAAMRSEVESAVRATADSARVARVVPDLLGADGDRRWFVGILGTSEARALGGIIGSHGVLTTTGGRLELGPMRRTAELNSAAPRQLDGVDEYLARYGRHQPDRTWQNVTLSPDGPTVARVVEQLYPQSGGVAVDGVVLLDPFALAELVRLVGPVAVPGWPDLVTAADVPRILLHEQYVRFERPDRLDFLGDVARAVFDRLTDGELPAPTRLAQVLGPLARDGHVVLHSTDDGEQAVFEQIGASGALPAVEGDFLGVITQNASGNKIDWFLRRTVDYDVRPGSDGTVAATLTVTLHNGAPATGLPDYVIGGSGAAPTAPGVNRMILSIYSALDLVDASIALDAERELGRNVYSAFVDLAPGETRTITVELTGVVDGEYRVDVHRQPLVVPDDVTVRVR